MRHQRLRRKLGLPTAHRKALLRNLAKSLIRHKRIRTTVRRAQEASAFVDNLMRLAKRGDLHARRLLISKLACTRSADTLIKTVAPQFKDRNGGYTRVLRLGERKGDAAQMALLEFTVAIETPEKKKPKKEKKKTKTEKKPAEETLAPKKPKDKEDQKPAAQPEPEAEKSKESEKKESEKRGGFLGALRKFLKGDE